MDKVSQINNLDIVAEKIYWEKRQRILYPRGETWETTNDYTREKCTQEARERLNG